VREAVEKVYRGRMKTMYFLLNSSVNLKLLLKSKLGMVAHVCWEAEVGKSVRPPYEK
jgi:hypothetical protein